MSYILDALRRAESERGRRRGVPGLHTQAVPATDGPDERRNRPWLWVVIGVSAGVLVPLLWRAVAVEPLPDEAAIARAPVAGNVTPQIVANEAAAAANAAAAAASAAAAAAAAVAGSASAPAAPAAANTVSSAASAAAATRPAPKAAPKAAPAAKAAAPARPSPASAAATRTAKSAPTTPALPAPAAAPATPEPRLRTLAELPEDLRRNVPSLAFGGSVYSEVPAQRMVILNGQVLREGDPMGDDLTIEQIRPRSAVLRVRGQRFELGF